MNNLSQRFLISLFFLMIGVTAYNTDDFIFIVSVIFFIACYFIPIGKEN